MAEPKTRPTGASVANYLNAIPDAQVREDCWTIAKMMQAATKAKPEMWGENIVGFGRYSQLYADGKEREWMLTGFSPRKQNITLYIMDRFERYEELMAKMGSHSCGKSCLYIKKLSDIHLPSLKKLVQSSVRHRISTASSRAAKATKRN